MAGSRGRSSPRRPTEKGNELANLFRIANGARSEPEPRRWFSEKSSVVDATLLEGIHLGIGVDQDAGGLVIAVSLEVFNSAGSCRIGVRTAIEVNAGESGAVEILGCEVRSQIRAMAKYRAVLHQAVAQKYALARHYIRMRKEDCAARVLYDFRNGRFIVISVVGEHAHNEEANEENDDRRLNPPAGDHESPSIDRRHVALLEDAGC